MPLYVVFVLQQTEYSAKKFLHRLRGLPDLRSIKKRGRLEKTQKAKGLILLAFLLYAVTIIVIFILCALKVYLAAVIVFLALPILCIFTLLIVTSLANVALNVSRKKQIAAASNYFSSHSAKRVAVLGSFGKTTMKEILLQVLGDHFNVAATPGNQNVPISIARWSKKLSGDEELLIFEYGEGASGDIAELANLSKPNLAIVTGVAPNHLDAYKSLDALEEDLGSIADFVDGENIFVNQQAAVVLQKYLPKEALLYSDTQVGEWRISDIEISIDGIAFNLSNGNESMHIASWLLGRHNIGPLAAVAVLSLQLGMQIKDIEKSISQTVPFEHRMQPRQVHGAWIIDDTYNGNFEGFKAGLELLKELPAKRKIYITPGLVDQGSETERVHTEIGAAIAVTKPDVVVLMKNSVTELILNSLKDNQYAGEIKVENNPLKFYTNIDKFIAQGDIVLMQNDWPDSYQ